jgi:hypothetical protein
MKSRISYDNSPWDMGWLAFENGAQASRNPFSRNTPQYKEWLEGYSSAMEEQQYIDEQEYEEEDER